MLRRGSLALFFGGCAIALSACGGGSSSSSPSTIPNAPTTTTGGTTAPTPTPSPGPEIPLSPGQSFTYKGTLTDTQLRLLPAPMPTATTVANVVQNGTIKDQQTYNGIGGLYDASVSESDATLLQTSTSQTDTYLGFSSPAPSGTTSLLEYGSTWADNNNDTLTYTYSTPLILGQLPEATGASWSNSAAVTVLENDANDANGSAFFTKTVYNADGSYSETTTFPANYGASDSVATQNSDGSGSITNVVGAGALVYGSPEPEGNGQYLLPFTVYAVPNPGPSAQPVQTGSIGAWYTVPATLYHETDTVVGSQAIPAACNVPSSVATSAIQTQRSVTRLDTVLGYSDNQTTNEYRVPSVGAVCVQMNDTQNVYYDFNGDSQFILSPSSNPNYIPTPIQVNTTTETLGLANGASPANAKRRTASSAVAPLSIQAITAAQMRFNQHVAQLRETRKLSFARAFKGFITKHQGGVR